MKRREFKKGDIARLTTAARKRINPHTAVGCPKDISGTGVVEKVKGDRVLVVFRKTRMMSWFDKGMLERA